jgi:GxxExxY protein
MNLSKDNELTGVVIGAAIAVHRQLGPELKEIAYEEALSIRLSKIGVANRRQVPLPLSYKIPLLIDGEPLSMEAEVPLVVASQTPVFSACAESLTPLHTATALARLRQGGWNQGLILNFHEKTMLQGIKRVAS